MVHFGKSTHFFGTLLGVICQTMASLEGQHEARISPVVVQGDITAARTGLCEMIGIENGRDHTVVRVRS